MKQTMPFSVITMKTPNPALPKIKMKAVMVKITGCFFTGWVGVANEY